MTETTTVGLLPGYETTYITRGETPDDTVGNLRDRIMGVVKNFGGEILITEDWGKRKLAYPIAKESRGAYSYLVYTGKPGVVHEVERTLKLQEFVIRHLTVKLGDDFDQAAFIQQHVSFKDRYARTRDPREARFERERGERGDRGDRGDRYSRDRDSDY